MSDLSHLHGRCGSCVRFVRVVENIDRNGEVQRTGECLLGVWPAPIYETGSCPKYVLKGTKLPPPSVRKQPRARRASTDNRASNASNEPRAPELTITELPEELLDMDMDQFRSVLREVLQSELGVGDAELGPRWEGGEMILKPGKEGTQEKRVPIESVFHKIVMIRDKLRVLEQKVNSHPKLSDEEKVQMQGYVTGCYGTLTTFNVLFADKRDQFVGQRSDD